MSALHAAAAHQRAQDQARATDTPGSAGAPRVLYLAPGPPIRSGISDYATSFAEAIQRYSRWTVERFPGASQLALESLRDFAAIRRRVEQWAARWCSGKASDSVDLVHAEIGYTQHDAFYTLYWLRRLVPGVPYVVTVHDPPLAVAPALNPLRLGTRSTAVRRALRVLDHTPIGRSVVRRVLGGAEHLFVLSGAGAAALQQSIPGARAVTALPFMTSCPERPVPRPRSCDTPRALFLGFWAPNKGLDVLIGAMERLAVNGAPPLRLALGGGPDHSRASQRFAEGICARVDRSAARQWIDVLGYLPPDEMDAALAGADVFVLPYTRGLGYSASSALTRAMTYGLPIIASEVPTLCEEITPHKTGILVPPANPQALAEALDLLARDHGLRRRLGDSAQCHVFDEHSPARVAQLAAAVYDSVRTGRGAAGSAVHDAAPRA